ncbi:MAG: hypothetical protein R2991_12765 [Thermoanaerobaculia bacterium]
MNATTIVTQKYFRGQLWRQRSASARCARMIDRGGRSPGGVSRAPTSPTRTRPRPSTTSRRTAGAPEGLLQLTGLVQRRRRAEASALACFILRRGHRGSRSSTGTSRRHDLQGRSGSGVNLPTSAPQAHVQGGGEASGPVSFMRGADARPETIKSGGKTWRPPRWWWLNVDHPTSRTSFDQGARGCKGPRIARGGLRHGSRRRRLLHAAVPERQQLGTRDRRVHAGLRGRPRLRAKAAAGGGTIGAQSADVTHQIAGGLGAADPGMQYDTTVNDRTPARSRGGSPEPCPEYMQLDNSACNLASLNLKKFYDYENDVFDVEAFRRAVESGLRGVRSSSASPPTPPRRSARTPSTSA